MPSDEFDREGFLDSIRTSPTSDYLFLCPLQHCPLITPIHSPNDFVQHLLEVHRVKIADPLVVYPFLQQYLDHYAEMINSSCRPTLNNGIDLPNSFIELKNDSSLRKSLQQAKLDLILQIQQRERNLDHLQPAACLFCTEQCSNKYSLFEHMFSTHEFNIGLLDNLVEVDEYLHKLRAELDNLKCIYCEKLFKSQSVLRKHMRKKGHFKIHPQNHKYDKYYVVNFTEPGKSWEALEEQEGDLVEADESSDMTDIELVHDLRTICLFDSCSFETPQLAVQHMLDEHNFSLATVFRTLNQEYDFYACIKIVNFLRKHSYLMQCFVCHSSFDLDSQYLSHINDHFSQEIAIELVEKSTEWMNDVYLKPFIENDPLLMVIEEILDNDI